MRFKDLSEYGLETKSLQDLRDPLRLREDIVRADLIDELHGIVLPYRRARQQPRKRP